ncbi:hypothetical protein F5J12DRAFT_905292 [Pisolithus orientalis]|uniref:uncharacterized protein n=1 Tax=Pisolithus orientalis TaxID=936130 RepID=UPI002224203B|nr:uncharacterized protein F5J12DRAFT_905292 [Pisolithus orientalis]KAI6008223.1 hypothetical protein F5J12DRAFT_905292 [Pisolithus orientalis]
MQKWRQQQPSAPNVHRNKVPMHLCLNLVGSNEFTSEEVEAAFLECLQRTTRWCREVGIAVLTVYDRDAYLVATSFPIRCPCLLEMPGEDSCESEVEYPLTPPLSEPSISRSQSPESAKLHQGLAVITFKTPFSGRLHKRRHVAVRRRPKSEPWRRAPSNYFSSQIIEDSTSRLNSLTIHMASRSSGKPAIACAARSLLKGYVQNRGAAGGVPPENRVFQLSSSELGPLLEGFLPPPDLMIVHSIGKTKSPAPPLEIHGFPPWQIMLTEFDYTRPEDLGESKLPDAESPCTPMLISETAFRRALDEYADAQFRLGR